ncbi:amino acid adenylation domain-containing protein [Dactylosporangium sp. NPDC000555]|uniref:non-ribosomal peptide synthetase n=1 Tax=Dactylosporangium sp. NPDC000555 TaxID=3154260 RepID=UPI003330678F
MELKPLSRAQYDAWLGHHFAPVAWSGTVTSVRRLRAAVDPVTLRPALAAFVERHDRFRSRFVSTVDDVRREVVPAFAVPLTVDDLTALPAAEREHAIDRAIDHERHMSFNLESGALLRARLIRCAPDEQVLCLTTHRICLDPHSVDLAVDELLDLAVGGPGRGEPTPAPPITDSGLAFWSRAAAGAVRLELPTDRTRPDQPSGAVGRTGRRLGSRATEHVLTAALVVLSRHGSQPDVTVGYRHDVAEPHTLPHPAAGSLLRLRLGDNPTFAEAVNRVTAACHAAAEHPLPTLDALRRAVPSLPQPPARVAVTTVAAEPPASPRPARIDETAGRGHPVAGAELELILEAAGEDTVVSALFDADIFDTGRIERLLGHIDVLAAAAAGSPTAAVSELAMLTDSEQAQLMTAWQGPAVEYPREPVHAQIREHARRRPDSIALRCDGLTVTYGELDRRAQALARRLRRLGVGRDDIVALLLDPGIDAVVAMLGVLHAGGAFAVLDPQHPTRRLEFILADTAARAVITHAALADRLPASTGWATLTMDTDPPDLEAAAGTTDLELAELADEHALAYVLYTSGSTGQPKGALIEHGSLSNFVLWPRWLFDLGPGDRMLQHMTLVFDFAEGEIFTALTSGATLVIAPPRSRSSPAELGALIADEDITCVFGPPAILNTVDATACPHLRYIVVGGDVCTPELVNHWNTPGRRFINGYGPTEATVGCTAYECEHRTWTAQPPIGRPMPNRLTYILDPAGRPCPVGVPGELFIGGAGLARGYLNRPGLTAERFVPDPWHSGQRLYRSGDLCEWTPTGQIRFLGRIDTQVKLNGLRVELEEIEAAIAGHPDVSQAAVSLVDPATGPRRLVAHVVPAAETFDVAALRAHVAGIVPGNLVPAHFTPIDALPLTAVGKIDRAALRALLRGAQPAEEFRAPRTPVQALLAAVVAELLAAHQAGQAPVGIDDDLIDAGLRSLDIVLLARRVSASLGAVLHPREVLAARTIAAIGELLSSARPAQAMPAPAGTTGPAPGGAPDAAPLDPLALLERIEQMDDAEIARVMR